MTETVEASVAHEFHASPEQVFDAWLNTDYVERWMSAALKSMEVEIDRPRKLVFTWFTSEEDEMENSSIVALTIQPNTDGCLATITNSMDVKYADYVGRTERGQAAMLAQVEATVAQAV